MITVLLIAINVAIFFMFPLAIEQFGLTQTNMSSPLIWVTSMFIHANALHLGMNMLALFQLGMIAEQRVSLKSYILIYFFAGIAGSLASFMYLQGVSTPTVVIGASGAIFGIFAFVYTLSGEFKSFFIQSAIFHGLIFVLGLPVAWYAHAGGAILGIVAALLFVGKEDY